MTRLSFCDCIEARILQRFLNISLLAEECIMRTLPKMEEDTVIAYDLGDIAKPHAKKMEGR